MVRPPTAPHANITVYRARPLIFNLFDLIFSFALSSAFYFSQTRMQKFSHYSSAPVKFYALPRCHPATLAPLTRTGYGYCRRLKAGPELAGNCYRA